VIGAKEALDWLEVYFSNPGSYQPFFRRDLDAQLRGESVVVSSGFRFSSKTRGSACPTDDNVVTALRHGGDPIGIGGDKASFGGEWIELAVGSDDSESTTRWYLPEREQWLVKMRQRPLHQPSVRLLLRAKRALKQQILPAAVI